MKKFITKNKIKERIDLIVIVILVMCLVFLHYYNKNISSKLLEISSTKLNEITNLYVKKDIVPKNIDINKLIIVNKNKNDEILYVDIDSNYANTIMIDVVEKIQNNLFEMNVDNDELLKKYNNICYLRVPLGLVFNGVLFSNLGPKIPVRLDFYEHAFGNIDVNIKDYGINNALVTVILSISLEQKLYLPYKEKIENKEFKLIIGSKIINGSVPSLYGGTISKSSGEIST